MVSDCRHPRTLTTPVRYQPFDSLSPRLGLEYSYLAENQHKFLMLSIDKIFIFNFKWHTTEHSYVQTGIWLSTGLYILHKDVPKEKSPDLLHTFTITTYYRYYFAFIIDWSSTTLRIKNQLLYGETLHSTKITNSRNKNHSIISNIRISTTDTFPTNTTTESAFFINGH